MKVGLFDHVERADRPLATLYEERLQFVEAADEAGFYCYHVAEHHCSPLNMVPVPGVYLGAVAARTKRIHLGPLVYLLPLYSPLRLIEEICMLDHLSQGRLEVGVGRGVSPFELNFHKVDHGESREIFIDAFKCISAGLAADKFSYAGKYFNYADVPMPMRPLQQPYPAFWYGSSNATGSTWAGDHGMHFTANGPVALAKSNIATFKEALDKRGGPAAPKAEFRGGTAIGVLRHIVVGDTDEQAMRLAKPTFEAHLASLNYLRNTQGSSEFAKRLDLHRDISFDSCVRDGMVIAGTPETVRAEIARQAEELGVNYLVAYLFFGTMQLSEAMRSFNLFTNEVMPALADL
jgi:alkanesulfonate monooxygenase SsuD/methylene tetrahydromethanopterin reductase-like flavin-dependent oxidoreductase (luciferase family)